MTDNEIVQASIKNANEQALQSKAARALDKGPSMFIAATSIACGALAKGGLSNKLAAGAAIMAAGAVIAGLSKPVHKAVDSLMNDKNKDEEGKMKHPLAQFAVELTALAGASALAIKGAKKGASYLAEKFAPAAQEIAKKAANAAKTIDKSKLGLQTEKLSASFNNFAQKHPTASKAVQNTIALAPAVGFIARSSSLSDKVIKERDENAVSNMNKLFLCREYAKAVNENSPASSLGVDIYA